MVMILREFYWNFEILIIGDVILGAWLVNIIEQWYHILLIMHITNAQVIANSHN